MRSVRRSGEPIYLRKHMVGLFLAICFPIVLLQLYKIYVGPISFGMQMAIGVVTSILTGLILYRIYRPSAQNQP